MVKLLAVSKTPIGLQNDAVLSKQVYCLAAKQEWINFNLINARKVVGRNIQGRLEFQIVFPGVIRDADISNFALMLKLNEYLVG